MEEVKTEFNPVMALGEIGDMVRAAEQGVSNLRKTLMTHDYPPPIDKGEILANVTIAMRHLEDAWSRLNRASCSHDVVEMDRLSDKGEV